jgi:AcrR family transcriptional regulator
MNSIAERRLEEKDRRRSEILDAAATVAARDGIDGITMERVARQARLSRALLYVYFRDRDDLHLGLAERALEQLKAQFGAAAAAGGTGLTQVQAMGRAYIDFARQSPVHFAALSHFHTSVADVQAMAGCLGDCLHTGNEVHALLMRSLEAGMQDGSIARAAGQPAAIAMTLWGFMHGIIQISTSKAGVLSQYGLGDDALANQALHLATRALAVGAALPTGGR